MSEDKKVISLKDVKLVDGDYLIDVLIQVIRDFETDGIITFEPFDIYIKLLAFNKSVSSRVEQKVTKTSSLVYNQHLVIEAPDLKKEDIEQGSCIVKVFAQDMWASYLISQFKLDLMGIYYSNGQHLYEHKWLAMINPEVNNNIRAIMKVSAQIIGPKDTQNQLEINLEDQADANVELILPPELNPEVYQWNIKIYRGRDIKIDAEWFGGDIDPYIKVKLGENGFKTEHRDSTSDPEYNECLNIPSNYPSMIQHVKFELYDYNSTTEHKLLATYNMDILDIEKNNLWGQFTWINFYTATNVNSAESEKIKSGQQDGNKFGGQLLVKINREKTNNPLPLGSNKILFDKATSDTMDQKSKLFEQLMKNMEAEGKTMKNYEKQAPVGTKRLQFYYELYYGCNMPGVTTKDSYIELSIGLNEIAKISPSKFENQDQYYWKSGVKDLNFDYIKIEDTTGEVDDEYEEKVWVYQIPDIVANYYTNGYCVSYKKFKISDIYLSENEFEGLNLRKTYWKEKIEKVDQEDDQLEENLKHFMPKVYKMRLDKSVNHGLIEERPGYLMLNIYVRDKDKPSDQYQNVMKWSQEKYLDGAEQQFHIRTFLFQGNNLPPADSDGLSDPFIKIYWDRQILKSEVVEKSLNPQYYNYLDLHFNTKTSNGKALHYLTPPMIIEVFDYDDNLIYESEEVLGNVLIYMYDYKHDKKMQSLKSTVVDKYLARKSVREETKTKEYDEEFEAMKKIVANQFVRKIYYDPQAFKNHTDFKPYIYDMEDFKRGEDSSAQIFMKMVIVDDATYNKLMGEPFVPDYINYNMNFYCIGFRNLISHGLIPVNQPYLYLRMQDLLPKEFKIMTKDIKTINSKGVKNNKSLFSKVTSIIKLPRDEYLMPTLGIQVKDDLLGFFGTPVWGSFDINLKSKTQRNTIFRVQKLKSELDDMKEGFFINQGKSEDPNGGGNPFAQKVAEMDFTVAKYYVARPPDKRNRINDIFVKIQKKAKIKFSEKDMMYPKPDEAVSGKFMVKPVFKKEGEIFVELTEYPHSILEPISFGPENKQYRFVVKYTDQKPNWCDTIYGEPLNLDYNKIKGYSNGKLYDIGEFCFYAMLEKENEQFNPEMKRELRAIKYNTINKLQMNDEYEIRLYILKGINIKGKSDGSFSDPFLQIYTEHWSYYGRAEYKQQTETPRFYKTFRFRAKIPETNTLTIEIWDYDLFCDEMIGKTVISLTERILYKTYMAINTKPVEEKPLYDDTSKFEKGRLRYILEIFPVAEQAKDIEIYSKITTAITSKVGSRNGSKLLSHHSSQNSMPNSHFSHQSLNSRRDLSNIKDTSNKDHSNGNKFHTAKDGEISSLSGNSDIPLNLNDSFRSKYSDGSKPKPKADVPVIYISKEPNGKKASEQSLRKSMTKRSNDTMATGEKVERVLRSEAEMAALYPVININPIPPRRFELRLVVWNAEEVVSSDIQGSVDAYVKVFCTSLDGGRKVYTDEKNTDTHWFCSNQCPNWNYRCVWDNYVIETSDASHYMHFYLYDKNIIGADELIGSAEIGFTDLAKFCYEENIRQSAIEAKDEETNQPIMGRIEWSSDLSNNIMGVDTFQLKDKGKDGDNKGLEFRGKILVSFSIIPYEQAELSKVGDGRSEPNLDPFLPEPAGRFSFTGGLLAGFFVITGKLATYIFNVAIIIIGIAAIGYMIYSFSQSFSGSIVAQLLVR